MRHLGLAAVAVVVLVAGLGVSFVESQANQPWAQTLGDNFMLARSLPFTVGLRVALGYARAHWPRKEESEGLLDVPSPIAMASVYRVHSWQLRCSC